MHKTVYVIAKKFDRSDEVGYLHFARTYFYWVGMNDYKYVLTFKTEQEALIYLENSVFNEDFATPDVYNKDGAEIRKWEIEIKEG